jgi:hypothetical protein
MGLLAGAVMLLSCVAFWQAERRGSRISIQLGMAVVMGMCALALALHLLPGFSNVLVIDDRMLKHGTMPFTLALNYDKTLAGALVLGWCWTRPKGAVSIPSAAMRTVVAIAAVSLVLVGAGIASGYVRWDPSSTGYVAVFVPLNLIVCLSEEAFFRGFLQTQWMRLVPAQSLAPMGILLSAVLFGVAHLAGGFLYVALACIAGLGYALVYHFTRRLECSVLTHLSVNTLHFVFFSYPALQSRLH